MATTISNADDTLTPLLVEGWQSSRETGTVLHVVLGSNSPAVTVRPARLRTGTLRTLWDDFTVACIVEQALAAGAVWTLADDDRPEIGMTFVVSGAVELELDDETRRIAWVSFEYTEVETS
jgi:hypothetical protein